jgi:hypothetical protein
MSKRRKTDGGGSAAMGGGAADPTPTSTTAASLIKSQVMAQVCGRIPPVAPKGFVRCWLVLGQMFALEPMITGVEARPYVHASRVFLCLTIVLFYGVAGDTEGR